MSSPDPSAGWSGNVALLGTQTGRTKSLNLISRDSVARARSGLCVSPTSHPARILKKERETVSCVSLSRHKPNFSSSSVNFQGTMDHEINGTSGNFRAPEPCFTNEVLILRPQISLERPQLPLSFLAPSADRVRKERGS